MKLLIFLAASVFAFETFAGDDTCMQTAEQAAKTLTGNLQVEPEVSSLVKSKVYQAKVGGFQYLFSMDSVGDSCQVRSATRRPLKSATGNTPSGAPLDLGDAIIKSPLFKKFGISMVHSAVLVLSNDKVSKYWVLAESADCFVTTEITYDRENDQIIEPEDGFTFSSPFEADGITNCEFNQ